MGTTAPKDPGDLARIVAENTEVAHLVERRLRRRTWWFAAILVAVVAVGAVVIDWRARETDRLHEQIDKDCPAFYASGMIPLPKDAAPVAHTFVDSFRDAYLGRCTHLGPLPPAPTLTPTPARTTR